MTEKNKDLYDFLKVKLDCIIRFLTVILVAFFGVASFLVLNFTKNSALLNILTISATIVLFILVLLFSSGIVIILQKMRGLLWYKHLLLSL